MNISTSDKDVLMPDDGLADGISLVFRSTLFKQEVSGDDSTLELYVCKVRVSPDGWHKIMHTSKDIFVVKWKASARPISCSKHVK